MLISSTNVVKIIQINSTFLCIKISSKHYLKITMKVELPIKIRSWLKTNQWAKLSTVLKNSQKKINFCKKFQWNKKFRLIFKANKSALLHRNICRHARILEKVIVGEKWIQLALFSVPIDRTVNCSILLVVESNHFSSSPAFTAFKSQNKK